MEQEEIDKLPRPKQLDQVAIVEVKYGRDHFRLLCAACSLVEKEGLPIPYLHLVAPKQPDTEEALRQLESGESFQTGLVRYLLPIHCVTKFEPGPDKYLIEKTPGDTLHFAALKEPPPDALSLDEIKSVLKELQVVVH